jgi:hypothetical protein
MFDRTYPVVIIGCKQEENNIIQAIYCPDCAFKKGTSYFSSDALISWPGWAEKFSKKPADILQECEIGDSRLRQISPELKENGLAAKLGRDWRYKPDAIDYIKAMPDGRGRPRKKQK